jgi:hypothetical protein
MLRREESGKARVGSARIRTDLRGFADRPRVREERTLLVTLVFSFVTQALQTAALRA